ncbi:MAG: hypothetical protein EB056_04760 [Verrucomicrobia bacterium]|nr:hypothetical protein [Verrucomicrobiota bacterium]
MLFAGGSLKKFAVPATLLAIFLMMGGHWVVLQTVAWTKMVMDYSKQSSVQQALSETFDGEHPCELCKQISRARTGPNKALGVVVFSPKEFSFVVGGFLRVMPPDAAGFRYPLLTMIRFSGPVADLPTPVPIS